MFKYFISEPTRIAITSGTQRITLPLHTGLIRINSSENIFKFYYDKPSIEYTDYISSKFFNSFVKSDQINMSNTVQLYKLGDRCIVDIPRIYFRNINMSLLNVDNYNSCILQTIWNDNYTIKSIDIIPPSEINKYLK
jgi:hypothetical protein